VESIVAHLNAPQLHVCVMESGGRLNHRSMWCLCCDHLIQYECRSIMRENRFFGRPARGRGRICLIKG